MKQILRITFCLVFFTTYSQKNAEGKAVKLLQVKSDSIKIDSVSISPFNFKIFDRQKKIIDTSKYKINFAKSIIKFNDTTYLNDSIRIEYRPFPKFLTKTYKAFDEDLIVGNSRNLSRLYTSKENRKNNYFTPFEGLNTNGSISRGITMGSNQDAVLNSNFDLQISGNLSKKVKIRANITDSNVPLQENGYTQRLNEFDKVFIEMFSDKWRVTAGDIQFKNEENQFMTFEKKVSGLSVGVNLKHHDNQLNMYASGGLVKGNFTAFDFQGIDGNQGPYKLTEVNENLLLISGSETVYVDGFPIERGEDKDYLIDYNTAEITFTTTYPITSNMRIHVEFQESEENFTRFISYNFVQYQADNFKVKLNLYNESDSKNQSLQQDLSEVQKEVLSNAGDDVSQMITLSAVQEDFIENKIQYKKELQNGIDVFVFSTNETDQLYRVSFSFVGLNQGDYIIQSTIATGRIYEYIAPVDNVKQGDYEPIVQLKAPNKLQIATLQADFNPNDKTLLQTEIAFSNNDKNLFSVIDDSNNQGYAGKLNWSQTLIDRPWKLKSGVLFELIDQRFTSIERFRNVEFDRDWNLNEPLGNQQLFNSSLIYQHEKKGLIKYQFEKLDFSENFKGNKHQVIANLLFNKTKIENDISFLESASDLEETSFTRIATEVKQHFKKNWIGGNFTSEENIRKEKITQSITNLSHRFIDYTGFYGIGDSTKVFAEAGYNFRQNDSLVGTRLQQVSDAKTIYLKSKLIQNKTSDLAVFINHRTVNNKNFVNNISFNTRVNYRQQLFDDLLTFNTVYETSSGSVPQQEFTYLEVEPGQGFYTWIDFDEDGIQDLDEFEIAPFQDQATYVRIALPTATFIKTNQNKFSQVLNINPSKWANKTGLKKMISHFINQTSVQIDNKHKRKNNSLQFNPFTINDDDVLSLKLNLKNSLFYNRGKQKFSTTYSFFTLKNKTVFVTGNQENNLETNQLQFQHKLTKFWLVDLDGKYSVNESTFENFASRNFNLQITDALGKLSYIYSKNTKLESFYNYKEKNNTIEAKETLLSHNFGLNFQYSKNQRLSLSTSVNLILNTFEGNQNSPVGFQMLEGLQDGKNFTWSMLFQKRLTSYLNLNLNYNGRKSEDSKTIHTGTVQLRANF